MIEVMSAACSGKAPLVVASMLLSLRAAAVLVVASMLLSLRAAAALAPPLLRRARRGAARAASVYESPELYDAAFGFRDFASEVDFLLGAHARHGSTGPAASVLELAAGPARHAVEAAARGLDATALDSSAAMAAYARTVADERGVDVPYVVGDMVDASAYETIGRVDTAWLLLGSAGHLLTADAAVAALRHAAASLAPGGTLVLELPHPRETFRLDDVGCDAWVATARDGADVEVAWGRDDDAFDPLTQIRNATVAFDVYGGGDVRTKVASLVDVVPTREFSLQEVLLLARLAGAFEADVATYGALDPDFVAADDDELAFRLVVVLTTKR